MSLICYRDLVGVAYTEDEIKAIAAQIEVVDRLNDKGEMFTRPDKLSGSFPQPYANEQAARFANGEAYPPDLIISKPHHNAELEMEERKLLHLCRHFTYSELKLLSGVVLSSPDWSSLML
ncbi:hypothetical protein Nepgr_001155 [Nepenthes gracilis]|uniref:Uncharacterized protein n=1 Tax=Nepenthes gracilis TaxID=150966 RepID=A0AAD3RX66_NEPGR|nr:hypothetical protein Nepgr_001155 [Nepenthes gracilis]